jgi:hypothetical protein
MNPIYRIDYNHNLLKLKKFIISIISLIIIAPVSELTKYTYRLLLANIKIKWYIYIYKLLFYLIFFLINHQENILLISSF